MALEPKRSHLEVFNSSEVGTRISAEATKTTLTGTLPFEVDTTLIVKSTGAGNSDVTDAAAEFKSIADSFDTFIADHHLASATSGITAVQTNVNTFDTNDVVEADPAPDPPLRGATNRITDLENALAGATQQRQTGNANDLTARNTLDTDIRALIDAEAATARLAEELTGSGKTLTVTFDNASTQDKRMGNRDRWEGEAGATTYPKTGRDGPDTVAVTTAASPRKHIIATVNGTMGTRLPIGGIFPATDLGVAGTVIGPYTVDAEHHFAWAVNSGQIMYVVFRVYEASAYHPGLAGTHDGGWVHAWYGGAPDSGQGLVSTATDNTAAAADIASSLVYPNQTFQQALRAGGIGDIGVDVDLSLVFKGEPQVDQDRIDQFAAENAALASDEANLQSQITHITGNADGAAVDSVSELLALVGGNPGTTVMDMLNRLEMRIGAIADVVQEIAPVKQYRYVRFQRSFASGTGILRISRISVTAGTDNTNIAHNRDAIANQTWNDLGMHVVRPTNVTYDGDYFHSNVYGQSPMYIEVDLGRAMSGPLTVTVTRQGDDYIGARLYLLAPFDDDVDGARNPLWKSFGDVHASATERLRDRVADDDSFVTVPAVSLFNNHLGSDPLVSFGGRADVTDGALAAWESGQTTMVRTFDG